MGNFSLVQKVYTKKVFTTSSTTGWFKSLTVSLDFFAQHIRARLVCPRVLFND